MTTTKNPNDWFLDAKRPSVAANWSGKTIDLGLRKPCRCDSGRKFKSCCMTREEVGKGWILLDAETRMPLAFDFAHVADIYKGVSTILVFENFQKADNYVQSNTMLLNAAAKLVIVRVLVEGLAVHIEQAFPKPGSTLLVLPFGVTMDVAGEAIRIDHEGPSLDEKLAEAGLVAGQDFVVVNTPSITGPGDAQPTATDPPADVPVELAVNWSLT